MYQFGFLLFRIALCIISGYHASLFFSFSTVFYVFFFFSFLFFFIPTFFLVPLDWFYFLLFDVATRTAVMMCISYCFVCTFLYFVP